MKIAILGNGKEGKSAKEYFGARGAEIKIFKDFTEAELDTVDFSEFDLILRSPSVRPRLEFSSMTRYFFDHCPAPIIGVTGTKGKGTTCSMITEILKALGLRVFLVGNIGIPALDELDKIKKDDVVVYEMSSFQLWDLRKSPHIAVVLRIEPDHLNVHKDFSDYVGAKGHIAEFQKADDSVIYFKNNPNSVKIAEKSPGQKIPYPIEEKSPKLEEVLDSLTVPGEHNRENAEAALLAVAEFIGVTLDELTHEYFDKLKHALRGFKGLPHHIEYVRRFHGVDYYDDSFSASEPSLEVAVRTFAGRPVVLIAGGKDRGLDLRQMKRAIFDAPNLVKAVLIGETRGKLADKEAASKYILADSLEEAVKKAREVAETEVNDAKTAEVRDRAEPTADGSAETEVRPVVLLSPGAASFDMFKDFYDRGDQFQKLVRGLR